MNINFGEIFANAFVEAARIWGEVFAANPWPWLGIIAMMLGLGALAQVASPRRRRSR